MLKVGPVDPPSDADSNLATTRSIGGQLAQGLETHARTALFMETLVLMHPLRVAAWLSETGVTTTQESGLFSL